MLLSVLLLLVPFGNSAGGHTSKFLQGGGMPLQRSRVEARGWASEGLESSDKVEKKRCRSRLSTGENHEIMEGCRNAVEEKPAIAPDNEERTFIFDKPCKRGGPCKRRRQRGRSWRWRRGSPHLNGFTTMRVNGFTTMALCGRNSAGSSSQPSG